MMRASSVAEATARAVVAAVGNCVANRLSKAPSICRGGRLGGGGDPPATAAARAGRTPSSVRSASRSRTRTISPMSPAASTRSSRRPPHDRSWLHSASGAAVHRLRRAAAAPTALPSRRNRRQRFWRRYRCLALAIPRTSGRPVSLRLRRRPSAVPTTICSSASISCGEEAPPLGEGEDEDVVRVQEERRGEDVPPEADAVNETGQAATRAEALVAAPLRPCGRRGSLAPAFARGGPAVAAPAQLSTHARAPRRRRRPASNLARRDAQRRRSHPALAAEAAPATAQASAADRRLRLDEVAHRGEPPPRPCAGAGEPARRSIHLRHPAHPGDAADATEAPRAGACGRRPYRQRFRRRHAHRRRAAGLSRRAALRQLRARRRGHHRLRRPRARRSARARATPSAKLSRQRLALELADAACERRELQAADRGVDRRLAASSTTWSTADSIAAIVDHVLALGQKRAA